LYNNIIVPNVTVYLFVYATSGEGGEASTGLRGFNDLAPFEI